MAEPRPPKAVRVRADLALVALMPGDSFVIQIVRVLVTIAISLAALAGVAQLLRIREFAAARDLVIGRLRRISA